MGEARDPGLAEDCCAQGGLVKPSSHALSWEAVQALNAFQSEQREQVLGSTK